jgi:rod shape determining protein RodA
MQLKLDWWIIGPVICLVTIGSLAIYSVGHNNTDLANYWWNHLLISGIGIALLVLLTQWDYRHLIPLRWVIYVGINLLLLAVLAFGTIALGAQRGINIAGFYVQPSEFAKICLMITIGSILPPKSIQTVKDLVTVLLVILPSCILVLIQPDLGTTIVLVAITLGMLYWAGAPLPWLLLLCSPVISAVILAFSIPLWFLWIATIGVIGARAAGGPPVTIGAVIINLVSGELGKIGWHLLHPYQRQRLVLFLNPDQDPLGGGYHLIQSRIAIGAGQFWGKGFMAGTQTQLNFIPEQHTDFIFTAIGEEWGFVGSMTVIVLFTILCLRLLVIAVNSRDNFGSLLAIGMLCLILFQTFINIGMTIGLAPVTGIPLPFLSYGRTAVIAYTIGLGLAASVANHPE